LLATARAREERKAQDLRLLRTSLLLAMRSRRTRTLRQLPTLPTHEGRSRIEGEKMTRPTTSFSTLIAQAAMFPPLKTAVVVCPEDRKFTGRRDPIGREAIDRADTRWKWHPHLSCRTGPRGRHFGPCDHCRPRSARRRLQGGRDGA